MKELSELTKNIYLWAAMGGWFFAQTFKILLNFLKKKKVELGLYASTGGMPSAHTATVTGLATSVGRHVGFSSATFAITVVFATVVITDALNLRREVGLHAKELQRLTNRKFNVLSGHTPLEVLIGAMIGFVTGWFL